MELEQFGGRTLQTNAYWSVATRKMFKSPWPIHFEHQKKTLYCDVLAIADILLQSVADTIHTGWITVRF